MRARAETARGEEGRGGKGRDPAEAGRRAGGQAGGPLAVEPAGAAAAGGQPNGWGVGERLGGGYAVAFVRSAKEAAELEAPESAE